MFDILATIAGMMVLAGTALNAGRWWRLRRARQRIPLEDRTFVTEHVGVTISLHGPAALMGMRAGKRYRTSGDLIASGERVVLATRRGVLLDLSAARGRRLASVRITGPGRLVVEGDLPSPSGPPGLFRFELATDAAADWAPRLGAHVQQGGTVLTTMP